MPEEAENPLFSQLSEWPLVKPGQSDTSWIDDLAAKCKEQDTSSIFEDKNVRAMLSGIKEGSPYLTGLIRRDPAQLYRILTADPDAYFASLLGNFRQTARDMQDMRGLMVQLRHFKAEGALLIGLADLGNVWPVMKVTEAVTKVADTAVSETVRYLFRAAQTKGQWQSNDTDAAASSGYFVLAMGKHGASELNYSSDIDLIIFYDQDKAKLSDSSRTQAFFVRMTRDLVKCLSEQTSDGYVFRTDLRLRPDPRSTWPAISTIAAMEYYESFGQNWERAAMIKARPMAGDIEAASQFLKELSPFMWRKHFDYAAIADVHAMKRQIHTHRGFDEIAVAGHNIKLGRGGIREIEFFVQTQQLIAGGRQPDLRTRKTLNALEKLVELNWIQPNTRDELTSAYRFLRRIENRIQMVADEQTHVLPSDAEKLAQFARFSGYADVETLSQDMRAHMEIVQKHYSALFEDMPQLSAQTANLVFVGEDDDPDTVDALSAMGYKRPSQAISLIRDWHRGHYSAVRSQKARERLTELQPILVEALAETTDPDATIIGFDRFLKRLPASAQWFELLKANSELLRLVVIIVGSAPRLANILSRRTGIIDAVLDARVLGSIPTPDEIIDTVVQDLHEASSYKDLLTRMRVAGGEQMFLIGVRVLTGVINAEQAGSAFAALAEELVRHLQEAILKGLCEQHGTIPGGALSIIALGKLGGQEMTASSDLDLITVYDFDPSASVSDGPRSISASHYYARFTQRLISAFDTPTMEGQLYKVDMRLRPFGQKSPIATKMSNFIEYEHHNAWTWEHMALTRARVISGPIELRKKIETTIRNVLVMQRDKKKIVRDVREMRERIESERGTDDIWNLKYVRGGFVDIEFTCQYLQLIHAFDHPDVLETNTQSAIRKLRDRDLIDAAAASTLLDTLTLMQSLGEITRLCFDGPFNPARAPDGLKDLLARDAGQPDFEHLEAKMLEALAASAEVFDEIVN